MKSTADMIQAAKILEGTKPQLKEITAQLTDPQHQETYKTTQTMTAIDQNLLAAIHFREANGDLTRSLGDGAPLPPSTPLTSRFR